MLLPSVVRWNLVALKQKCKVDRVPVCQCNDIGQGGIAHLPRGHFFHVSICLPHGDSKMTPTVHILMIEKVSFNEPPMKSKTRPGFLHIYTFKLLLSSLLTICLVIFMRHLTNYSVL